MPADSPYFHPRRLHRYSEGVCSNGSVGCVVGQSMTKAGLEHPVHDEYDFGELIGGQSHEVRSTSQFDNGPFRLFGAAASWIASIQDKQDEGQTWGEALAYADGVHRYIGCLLDWTKPRIIA